MSTTSTSTNPPYSGTTSSSTTAPSSNPIPSIAAAPHESVTDFSFTSKEVLVWGGTLVLTAVITYFSTLISVNSDIANNRENISIVTIKVDHLQDDLSSVEGDISNVESDVKKIGAIEVTISGLEKQFDTLVKSSLEKK